MKRRIRLRDIEAPVFPPYIPSKLIAEHFEFVQADYDFCFLPLIDEPEHAEVRTKEYWTQYIDHRSRFAVINTLYEYGNRSSFSREMANVCNECQVVFGYQLPIGYDHPGLTPIFYPSLVEPIFEFGATRLEEDIDICFWGAIEPSHKEWDAKTCLRSRDYRGCVIVALEQLAQRSYLRTSFKSVHYWQLGQHEQAIARQEYRQVLLRSKLCLSIYGYGYNCYRNAEIFALGRPLFSPMLHHHVLVPEAELWHRAELGFFFEDDGTNIEGVLLEALTDDSERCRRAYNGWLYHQRNCTRRGIAEAIYHRLLTELGEPDG